MPEHNHPLQLVLASQSPRREELLALTGLSFELESADVDENCDLSQPPAAFAKRLARKKAEVVAYRKSEGTLVIAADTIVVSEGEILGKPRDAADADRMLRQLRGRSHEVITAIAVKPVGETPPYEDTCSTEVQLREFADDELADYIASGNPFDKAGAYAIQNKKFHPAVPVGGCFANVMGLPLCHLTRTLRWVNVYPESDVAVACQAHNDYDCPIYQQILEESG